LLQCNTTRRRVIRSGEEMPLACPHLAAGFLALALQKIRLNGTALRCPATKNAQKNFAHAARALRARLTIAEQDL
jgi:hypothetical protein